MTDYPVPPPDPREFHREYGEWLERERLALTVRDPLATFKVELCGARFAGRCA